MEYISAHETAKRWGVSQRRVCALCAGGRVPHVKRLGNMWLIPEGAEKPKDARKRAKKKPDGPIRPKPFLKWAGGKRQLVEAIRQRYPKGLGSGIHKYAEPFVGGGAVLFDILQRFDFSEIYISDTNAELIHTYRMVRDHVEELILRLSRLQEEFLPLHTEERKKFYYKQRKRFNALSLCAPRKEQIEKAACFIFLNKTCFNGLYRVNRRGKYNVPMGAYKNPVICDVDNLRAVSAVLQKVQIVCADYSQSESFIDSVTFAYFDPPYRPLNHTSNFTAYTQVGFQDEQQEKLAQYIRHLAQQKGAFVLTSNSDPKNTDPEDDFLDTLYSGFQIDRVNAVRLINRDPKGRGEIKELLISNYE